MEDQILYKRRHEIDEKKWNQCIDSASNGSVYAYSFYLDHMADHWDAIILNDYRAIMPLPWKRKLGIYYLYQPFLSPKLGVIGENINEEVFNKFLRSIPSSFSFLEINLNEENLFEIPDLPLQKKINYKIPLHRSYSEIIKCYNQNVRRNIQKARTNNCVYKEDLSVDEVFVPAISQFSKYTQVWPRDANNFKKLINRLVSQKHAKVVGVYEGDKFLSGCIFLFDKKAAYYILATTNTQGRRIGASHFLLDQFIKDNAGKVSMLDLAGSDIPSVGLFYKSFGGEIYFYSSLKWNRLPPLIRWIKK